MEESVIRINFMDESVTRKDHGRICNKLKIREESVTRRQNHGRICNMKKNSCKNLSQEKKFMEEYVTSRNS